ncbi:50S ribosomal protein L30 [Alicyclobacillus ferrooxydans]|uniref:Large ribosomal subunit protein uL30 n=1 Tax=Alicyclobacillus ferrooxydans TaxID=471514 RepID=A0A0P9ELI6_9BACL|nr:50S ribosomal protein L30 [Alicyclobacillus ferrooxydans]KPV44137.1 50S ribosomal protein L30 [Alicyclobacillus ferrooxydans]
MATKLSVTLKHSPIGRPLNQRKTVVALGLRKMQMTVVHEDTPVIRGMINRVKHLVEVTVVEAE